MIVTKTPDYMKTIERILADDLEGWDLHMKYKDELREMGQWGMMNYLLSQKKVPDEELLTQFRKYVEALWKLGDITRNVGRKEKEWIWDRMYFLDCIKETDLINLLADSENRVVLDCGSGKGSSFASYLQELGAKVIALDMNTYALRTSENPHFLEHFPDNYQSVGKIQGDYFEIPLRDGTVDIAVGYYYMADNPFFMDWLSKDKKRKRRMYRKFVSELDRVLIDGGIFISKDPRSCDICEGELEKAFSSVTTILPTLLCARKGEPVEEIAPSEKSLARLDDFFNKMDKDIHERNAHMRKARSGC
jgi:SAM-dependent methyltransferase